jgi:septum site-determining protein MinD
MARIIVITSGKGGVGKTTICANLGCALARLNLKVLLIDVDFGLNNLDVVMGVENKIVYDITDIIEGKCRAKQALIQDFYIPNLYMLPSNHTYTNYKIDSEKIKSVLQQVENSLDYILIDCPAGIEVGFHRAVKCSNEAIVVTTPHLSAIRDADKVLSLLNSYNLNNINLIVNRARGDLMLSGDMLTDVTISDYLKINLIGVVPEDDVISTSLLTGQTSSKFSAAYNSFNLIANYLHNGKKEIYDCTKKYKGFFGSIKQKVKKIV